MVQFDKFFRQVVQYENHLSCIYGHCKWSKNNKISKRLEGASIKFVFYKIQCELSRFRLNAILFVLEYFSFEEENENQIPLALYIRLGYSQLSFV